MLVNLINSIINIPFVDFKFSQTKSYKYFFLNKKNALLYIDDMSLF